jgi:LDH2 family malate/lactate/ureidoglycolate dehydrogenase
VTHAEGLSRLRALGLSARDAEVLWRHFDAAERAGKASHGHARIAWLETQTFAAGARPRRLVVEPAYERWDGAGALGYLVLDAIVTSVLEEPPPWARLVVAERCFPTGMLGDWTRRLADGGLVAVATATSPRRLPHPEGGEPLTGTNPVSIAIPSAEGPPVVADVSMGAVTHGDVLAGRARPEELVPFGGVQAHKAFALAVGLELLVSALAGPEHGVVLLVARPEHDPVPAFRALAAGRRLPGDASEPSSPAARRRQRAAPGSSDPL